MKLSLFGFEVEITKQKDKKRLYELGAGAKRKQSWEKIESALKELQKSQKSMSEYQIQKVSGVSINTVKKYRKEIQEWKEKNTIKSVDLIVS